MFLILLHRKSFTLLILTSTNGGCPREESRAFSAIHSCVYIITAGCSLTKKAITLRKTLKLKLLYFSIFTKCELQGQVYNFLWEWVGTSQYPKTYLSFPQGSWQSLRESFIHHVCLAEHNPGPQSFWDTNPEALLTSKAEYTTDINIRTATQLLSLLGSRRCLERMKYGRLISQHFFLWKQIDLGR